MSMEWSIVSKAADRLMCEMAWDSDHVEKEVWFQWSGVWNEPID